MGKTLTYEFVKGQIEKEGYKLLSTKYKNVETKLELICPKNHVFKITYHDFQQRHRCRLCSIDKVKTSFKYIKEYFEKEGYTLLSKKYINSSTKLKTLCPNGHTYYVSWNHFQSNGARCKICCINDKTFDFNFVNREITKEGYKILSTNYINVRSRLKIQCPKGHIYTVAFYNWRQGSRCHYCASDKLKLSYDFVKSEVEKEGYKLLSTNYINNNIKLEIKCNKGHIYRVTYNNFRSGYRCPQCSFDNKKRVFTAGELDKFTNYRQDITQISRNVFYRHYYQINPDNLKRGFRSYHLDHIYSVMDGFRNDIPSEVISNPNNLQILWWSDNISKFDKSGCTKQELYLGYYKYKLGKE